MFLRAIFLIIRDSPGSNVKQMQRIRFCHLFVLYLLILDGVPGEKVVSEDEEPSPSQVQKTGRAQTGLSRRAPHDVGVWTVVPGLVPAAGGGGSLGQALNPRQPWQS